MGHVQAGPLTGPTRGQSSYPANCRTRRSGPNALRHKTVKNRLGWNGSPNKILLSPQDGGQTQRPDWVINNAAPSSEMGTMHSSNWVRAGF